MARDRESGALRIGIDAHAIGRRKTGNERFMANLIPSLRAACRHHLVLYFTDREAARSWPAMPGTDVRLLQPSHPLIRIPLTLPYRAARDRLDVLLVQYTAPPVLGCPVVTVVHDVAFQLFPELFSPPERLWMRRTIPFTMRRAAGVVTVSNFSRDEIVRVFGLPSDRITVAHNGVDPVFIDPAPRPSLIEAPFFLSVGNLQPRKNLVTLMRGFAKALERRPDLPERLVVVGQDLFAASQIRDAADRLRWSGRIEFTGYVGDHQLVGLLQRATGFTYPSIYEGFGLPPIEAMAAGVPVAVSDIPVMREVAGEAALLVPPLDVNAWADAFIRLSSEPDLRSSLVERGRARAASYTWARSASEVLSVLESAAATRRRGARR